MSRIQNFMKMQDHNDPEFGNNPENFLTCAKYYHERVRGNHEDSINRWCICQFNIKHRIYRYAEAYAYKLVEYFMWL